MLKIEAVLLRFVVGEEDVPAAMVSMAMLDDVVESEGPGSGRKGEDTPLVIARITSILQLSELKPS